MSPRCEEIYDYPHPKPLTRKRVRGDSSKNTCKSGLCPLLHVFFEYFSDLSADGGYRFIYKNRSFVRSGRKDSVN
jgi:hypothetical protein